MKAENQKNREYRMLSEVTVIKMGREKEEIERTVIHKW